MIVHLNGAFVPAAAARISVWDGGFLYGDGVYTTLRLYRGVPLDLPAHLARVARHAAALDLPCPLAEGGVRNVVAELVRRNGFTSADSRLRITVSRGADPDRPMPLDRLERIAPTVLMTLGPLPEGLDRAQEQGIAVTVLGPEFARGNFPDLKTLNGLPALLALRRAAARGCREALLTGPDGRLLEGAVSNLLLVVGDRILTPAAGGGLLAGRTRERILGLARDRGWAIEERNLYPPDLAGAGEVFLAGSVREIQPVVAIDDRPVGDGRPGPRTRQLQAAYRERVARELDAV